MGIGSPFWGGQEKGDNNDMCKFFTRPVQNVFSYVSVLISAPKVQDSTLHMKSFSLLPCH